MLSFENAIGHFIHNTQQNVYNILLIQHLFAQSPTDHGIQLPSIFSSLCINPSKTKLWKHNLC